jgi:hypothetical protein
MSWKVDKCLLRASDSVTTTLQSPPQVHNPWKWRKVANIEDWKNRNANNPNLCRSWLQQFLWRLIKQKHSRALNSSGYLSVHQIFQQQKQRFPPPKPKIFISLMPHLLIELAKQNPPCLIHEIPLNFLIFSLHSLMHGIKIWNWIFTFFNFPQPFRIISSDSAFYVHLNKFISQWKASSTHPELIQKGYLPVEKCYKAQWCFISRKFLRQVPLCNN